MTAGLPQPLPAASPNSPARFAADQIEHWLAHHPQVRWRQDCEALTGALTHGHDREQAIRRARHAGLSWTVIASLVHEADPREGNRSRIFARYRHLD